MISKAIGPLLFSAALLAPAASVALDFSHAVVPVLKKHCAECHTGEKKKGGFSMNTRDSLIKGSENGPVVEPGKASASVLYEVIASDDPDLRMPPKGPRPTGAELAVIRDWIDSGLSWEPGFTFGRDSYEPLLKHRKPSIPTPGHPVANDIDRIVFSDFESRGLPLPGPVGDGVFLRRAYLDLTGLLPSREETESFLRDTDPGKRAALVDRLLSRDADYAAHWLSFWNDLLRNAYRGTGFIDGGRKAITGWIIPALASNKPYDRMIEELVAPSPKSEGFIRGIRWRGEVNASQTRAVQFAQNVGQVFLGINMKCASCHDSFIDRWKLEDAYGLAAIVSEEPVELHRCDKSTGEFARASWVFPELGNIDPAADREARLRQLAALLTHPDNGRTTRTLVNRLWHRLFGRGIVHPVDAMDMRPWNEDLLDLLANEFVSGGYDLRHILGFMAKSLTYQLPSVKIADDADLVSTSFRFEGPVARLMTAEQFVDTLEQVGGITRTQPRSFLLAGDAAVEIRERLTPLAPPGTVPPENKVEMRSRFEIAEAVEVSIQMGHSRAGTVILTGEKLGSTGVIQRKRLDPGSHEVLIRYPAGGNRDLDLTGFVSDGDRLIVDGRSSWEFRIEGGDWKALVPFQSKDARKNRQVDARREAVIANLLRLRFPHLRHARASLRDNDLLMRSLGRPNREQIVTMRRERLTMLQAMDLSNGADFAGLIREVAGSHGEVTDPREFTRDIYLKTLCREPSEAEVAVSAEILSGGSLENREDFFWSIFLLPEYQIVR